MKISDLKKVNSSNITAAGPRYTPTLDPNAPNLEIVTLVRALEALGLTDKYRNKIIELEIGLEKAWKEASKKTQDLIPSATYKKLIISLKKLPNTKAGQTKKLLASIERYSLEISKILSTDTERLREEERTTEENSEQRRVIQSDLSSHRKFGSVIREVLTFTKSPKADLVKNNLMLLLGEWGTGKTHLLCDLTVQRMKRGLPTLFLLAIRLQGKTNPLESLCSMTGLASTPNQLLKAMNTLGYKSGGRALIIFDGINEGDKKAWKKHIKGIISLATRYKNVGIILSCRTPFDRHIFSKTSRKHFTQLFHNGFQEIEFDAQKAYFDHYGIPTPQVPLLTPEFSRPLFLKILCLTFSGKTSSTKSRWIKEIASGQKSMTKLFEDFVVHIGSSIESDFGLSSKTCWRILKGEKLGSGKVRGIAVLMADRVKDHIKPNEAVSVIKDITGNSESTVKAILNRMTTDGLLSEDIVWENGTPEDIIRMPYQRFSDHLVVRHLLKTHLNTTSETHIRRSFYKDRPLGKIFEIDRWGQSYKLSGLASAIMLEFPERVKNALPTTDRELVYYLPRARQLMTPFVDTFLEGALWRNKDSFSIQTDKIFDILLSHNNIEVNQKTFEVIVTIACRRGHPYSAEKLYEFLEKKGMAERDLSWSEYIRNSYEESVIHKLLDWIIHSDRPKANFEVAKNFITLVSLFLTTTDRSTRDRATKALVTLGVERPKALFKVLIKSLKFNDPYIPERLLAAAYGVLMRRWAFPSSEIKVSVGTFAREVYDNLFAKHAPYATTHILARDYALGILELALRIDNACLKRRSLKRLTKPFTYPKKKIPSPSRISEKSCKPADSAIDLDFGNYTIGRLVPGRGNYEFKHEGYKDILRQIKWRILNLGYSPDLFKDIDESIAMADYYRMQRQSEDKVDRYGKKYSWIAFFEAAGIQSDKGILSESYSSRISDCDIDPSFPEKLREWKPPLKKCFRGRLRSPRSWAVNGGVPSYDHLLIRQEVDNIDGPWVMVAGYISESAQSDSRRLFTFISPVLAIPSTISKLRYRFNTKEYPGNREIPEPWADYYTFAGEVPWSEKFCGESNEGKSSKRHMEDCFSGYKSVTVRKKASELSVSDMFRFTKPIMEDDPDTGDMTIKLTTNPEILPKYVDVPQYKSIPGIEVEIPYHRLSWESYHSTENQGGYADFLAPALCEFLNLRNKDNSQDLFDARGKQASIYRIFLADDSEFHRSHLLYIRKDLLEKYLRHTKQKLVWFIWGERDIKNDVLESIRSEMQDVWLSHKHIHMKMKVTRV